MASRRTRRLRWLVGVASALLAIGYGGLVAIRWRNRPLPPPPLKVPTPNGYDDLVAAGKQMTGNPPAKGRFWDADADELAAFLGPNRDALRDLRASLGRESVIPIGYTRAYLTFHIAEVGAVRRAARVLEAEGVLAAKRGEPAEAAGIFLDLIRMGRSSQRGGLLLDVLIGLAAEGRGVADLERLRPDLDADACRRLARALEEIDRDRGREPLDVVLRREAALADASMPVGVKLSAALIPTVSSRLEARRKPAEASAAFAVRRADAQLRLLIADLALRAYRLEHGAAPEGLAALVPGYLAAVPADPFRPGGGPLSYRAGPDGHALYSVGPDGEDDGGTAIPEMNVGPAARGDLVVAPR